jgi:hypothetical protein
MSSNSQKNLTVSAGPAAPGGLRASAQDAETFGVLLSVACAYIKCVVKRITEENLYSPFALARLFLRTEEYGGLVWGNSVEADWIDLVGTLLTHDYSAVDEEEWQAVLLSHRSSPSQVPSLSISTYPPYSPYDLLCDDGPESLAELQEMLLGLCADPSFPKPKPEGLCDLQYIWYEAIKTRIDELFESVGMGGLFSPMVLFQDAEGNRNIVPIIRIIPARPLKANGEKGPRPHPRTIFTRENAFKLFKACEDLERCNLRPSPRYQNVLILRKERANGSAAPAAAPKAIPAAGAGGKKGNSRFTNINQLRKAGNTPANKISSLETRISKQKKLLAEMAADAEEHQYALLHLQNLKDELRTAQQAVEAAQQGPHESVFQIHNWNAGSEETQNGKPKSLKEIMAEQAAQKGKVMAHIKITAGLAAAEAQTTQSSRRMGCLMPSNFECTRTRSQTPWMGHVMRSERTIDPSANYVPSGELQRARIKAAMSAPASAPALVEAPAAPAPVRDERTWRIFEQVHTEVETDLYAPVLDDLVGFQPVPKSGRIPELRQPAPTPKMALHLIPLGTESATEASNASVEAKVPAPAKHKKSGKLTGNQRAAKKAAATGEVPICRNLSKPEGCKFGDNCHFRHPEITVVKDATPALSSVSILEEEVGSTTEALCQNISMSHSAASAVAETISAKPAPTPVSVLDIFAKLNPTIGGISFSAGSSPMDLAGLIAAQLRETLHKQGTAARL